jgi:HD-like signal output (HDOD) protein
MESDTLDNPTIGPKQILKAAACVGFLGAGASSAARMMAILCAPHVDDRDVASVIKKEPAICARVLRVANSTYYGQARVISSLERALPVLGQDAVRGIAAAACMCQAVTSRPPGDLLDIKALLWHSLATASAAESLARIRHESLAAEAFIVGLLHNLGVVIQRQLDGPGIDAMIRARQMDESCEIRALESQYAAIGHEECIALILDAWQLPEALVAAVRHHHDPMAAPVAHRDLAGLVNLGAQLAVSSGCTFALEPVYGRCSARVLAHLELSADDVDGVALELPERAARLGNALFTA